VGCDGDIGGTVPRWALAEDLRCRVAAPRSTKAFPLTKGAARSDGGRVAPGDCPESLSKPIPDNPLKASRPLSLAFFPLGKGEYLQGPSRPYFFPAGVFVGADFPFPSSRTAT
jgi:hypothetical protein